MLLAPHNMSGISVRRSAATRRSGFTLVEIIIALVIIVTVGALFIASLGGAKSGDNIDRAAQLVYNDLVYMRMKAVSTNQTYRLSFPSNNQWKIEYYDTASSTWVQEGETRNTPSLSYFTSTSLANAASNLEATASGLYRFQNSATGTPYITAAATGLTKSKSVIVAVGGALSFDTN